MGFSGLGLDTAVGRKVYKCSAQNIKGEFRKDCQGVKGLCANSPGRESKRDWEIGRFAIGVEIAL